MNVHTGRIGEWEGRIWYCGVVLVGWGGRTIGAGKCRVGIGVG